MHIRVLLSKYRAYTPCAACGGARLKPDALLWRLGTKDDADACSIPTTLRPQVLAGRRSSRAARAHVHDLMLLPIERARVLRRLHLPAPLDEATDLLLARDPHAPRAISCEVGLGYLTLDRQSRTLSGGEVQRINLTTALGTSLVNTLFVLDEPSIGLHPRDMGRVIDVMQRLRDAGNSLVVVEHDPQIMLAADRILDMGPGPGRARRRDRVLRHAGRADSDATIAHRRVPRRDAGARTRRRARAARAAAAPRLELRGAAEHNLKDIDVAHPAATALVCVTGVSGSGKSTLVQDVLLRRRCCKPRASRPRRRARTASCAAHEHDRRRRDRRPVADRPHHALQPGELRRRLRRHPRALRRARRSRRSAATPPGTFSFNSGNGRCPTCGGNGFEHVEMQFLSDVYLRCPDCDGRRYPRRGARGDVTGATARRSRSPTCSSMTVAEALAFFADQPRGASRAAAARGRRASNTCGSASRCRRSRAAKRSGSSSPAIWPRPASARRATRGSRARHALPVRRADDRPALRRHREAAAARSGELIAAGHSLVVIEHNLDVIRAADWIIDLGPEGGDAGGEIVVRRHAGGRHGERALAHRAGAAGVRGRARRRRAAPVARACGGAARSSCRSASALRRRDPRPQRARAQPARTSTSRSRATTSP